MLKNFPGSFKDTLVLVLIFILLSGCSIVGNKEVLLATNSQWSSHRQFSQVSYEYQCERLWVSLDEVVLVKKVHSYGLLLPIIPSGQMTDKTEENLQLNFKIVSEMSSNQIEENDIQLTVKQENNELHQLPQRFLYKTNEKPIDDGFLVEYRLNYHFPIKLKDVNELSIDLVLPSTQCNPIILNLKRQIINDNEFILAPGP
jgi:hypothetical protein